MAMVVLFVLSQYGTSGVLNSDFYSHLLNGEWILGHYALPGLDSLSWSQEGKGVIASQWGAEVLLTVAWLLGGGWGTKVLAAGLACVLLFVMHHAANTQFKNPLGAIALTMLLAGGTVLSLSAGPSLISYVLFGVTVHCAEWWRETKQRKAVIWLAPIFLVWSNVDSAFLLGLLYVALMAVGMGIGFVLKSKRPADFWKVSPWIVGVAVATLCTVLNPYGISGLMEATKWMAPTAVSQYFAPEWAAPTLQDRAGQQLVIAVVLTVAVAGFSRRRMRAEEILVFTLLLGLGFRAKAFVPYMMIGMLPILARMGVATNLADWVEALSQERSSIKAQVLVFILGVVFCVMTGLALKDNGERSFRAQYPSAAVDFLIDHHLTSRVMHDPSIGGYLAYAGGIKPFADRRLGVFESVFMREVANALQGKPGALNFVRKWNPEAVLLSSHVPLAQVLDASSDYALAYSAEGYRIYLRADVLRK